MNGDGRVLPVPGQVRYSRHARVRRQQRGIPPVVVDWVVGYGRATRKDDATVFSLDKPARRRLARDLGELAYRRIEDLLDVYVVLADGGVVVTVAKRCRRARQ